MTPIPERTILYNCFSIPNLSELTNYVPCFLFVDPRDLIPGISNSKLPSPTALTKDTILKIESEFVYVKNIEIFISDSLEENILSIANKYRSKKYSKI